MEITARMITNGTRRLGTREGYHAARIRLAIVYVLDDQGDSIDSIGFGDSFHESIGLLMILIANPHHLLQALLGGYSISIKHPNPRWQA